MYTASAPERAARQVPQAAPISALGLSLGFNFVWSGSQFVNPANGRSITLSANGITNTSGPAGKGLAFAGGASTGGLSGAIVDTAPRTIIGVFSNVDGPGGGTSNNGRGLSTFNGTGGMEFFFGAAGSITSVVYFVTTNDQRNYASALAGTNYSATAIALSHSGIAGDAPIMVINGAVITPTVVTTTGSGARQASGSTFGIGYRPDVATRQMSGRCYFAAHSSKTLNAAQLILLTMSPISSPWLLLNQ